MALADLVSTVKDARLRYEAARAAYLTAKAELDASSAAWQSAHNSFNDACAALVAPIPKGL